MKKKILMVVLILAILGVGGYFVLRNYFTFNVEKIGDGAEAVIDYTKSGDNVEKYEDKNGNVAYIPKDFKVSSKTDEQTINTGLVVIGPDESEFVWIPTTTTKLMAERFGPISRQKI